MSSVFILGRQPALGMAELESLYGADALQPLGSQAVVVDVEPKDVPMSRLGGSMRLAKLLNYLPYTDWGKIEDYITDQLPLHTAYVPEGKIRIGISLYGLRVGLRQLNNSGLAFKKAIKSTGRSVRVVPNKELELNTAQVIHNQLTGPTGMELLLIRDGDRVALAQTVAVQDIDAYAARDQARPMRDARVGMLPPKLAQIIVNLAVGAVEDLEAPVVGAGSTILDPFCGTGVVLQEALLMGYQAYGTDLEPRMIEYSRGNLDWLSETTHMQLPAQKLEVGDATSHHWKQPISAIACETYLGRPLNSIPTPEILNKIMTDCDTIHSKFLRNLARQIPSGTKLCIGVPAWKTKNGFKHLRTLDSLEELGYNRISFVHVDARDLIYHRENQVVARELVTLIRK